MVIKKEEIAIELSKMNDMKKKDAIKIVNDVFDIIKENVKIGNTIQIYGMLSIETKEVPQKTGIMNSKKDENIVQIPYIKPEHRKISIKISDKFKNEVE